MNGLARLFRAHGFTTHVLALITPAPHRYPTPQLARGSLHLRPTLRLERVWLERVQAPARLGPEIHGHCVDFYTFGCGVPIVCEELLVGCSRVGWNHLNVPAWLHLAWGFLHVAKAS